MQTNRLEKLLQMVAETPGDVFLMYAVAMEYRGLQDREAAVEWLRKTLQSETTHVPSWFQLGILYRDAGDETQAIACLEEALKNAITQKQDKARREIQAVLDELVY